MDNLDVWSLVQRYESLLKRELRKYLPRYRWKRDLEDMYADVVLGRCVAIMHTYDPDKGASPATHLVANVRWYAYKYVHRRCYKPQVLTGAKSLSDMGDQFPGMNDSHGGETTVQVRQFLERVHDTVGEWAADLLRWRLINGCTFGEIADHLDVTRAVARGRYEKALKGAKATVSCDRFLAEFSLASDEVVVRECDYRE